MPTASDESMNEDFATATVRYARARPWTDQWWVTLWWQFQVDGVYKGQSLEPANTSTYKLIVNEACLSITHVADWITNDPSNPLTASDVETIVDESSFIKIARDVANTAKHHTRSNPKAPTAQIGEVFTGVGGDGTPVRSVTINWNDGKGRVQTYDARTVVDSAIAEWLAGFAQHGIENPFPDGL